MASLVEQYLAAGKLIDGWSGVLLLTHERPDGDALGGLIGLYRMLKSIGKKPSAFLFDPPAPRFDRLRTHADLKVCSGSESDFDVGRFDGIIIVDTCALQQLTPIAGLLKRRPVPVLAIDHHLTRDEIADCYVVDESASSSSLMVAEMAPTLGWQIDANTAEALFTGMTTDTGWFRFSNTDSRTLEVAGRLLQYGVKPGELYQAYYMSDTPARMRLIGLMLSEIELHADGRLAVMCITQEMLQRCGASRADTEELVNEAMRIGSIESSILLSALDEEVIKVSLRSKRQVNCAAVAAGLGGGGHERAAGVRIKGDLQAAKQLVVHAVVKELTGQSR